MKKFIPGNIKRDYYSKRQSGMFILSSALQSSRSYLATNFKPIKHYQKKMNEIHGEPIKHEENLEKLLQTAFNGACGSMISYIPTGISALGSCTFCITEEPEFLFSLLSLPIGIYLNTVSRIKIRESRKRLRELGYDPDREFGNFIDKKFSCQRIKNNSK